MDEQTFCVLINGLINGDDAKVMVLRKLFADVKRVDGIRAATIEAMFVAREKKKSQLPN